MYSRNRCGRRNRRLSGALDAWLVIRGIKTLPLRMEQHQKNAFAIAKWLQKQLRVQYVLYPGLENHPGYEINKAQTTGFGGMISFAVDNAETARQILEGVKLIKFAESLGGTESLITYPIRRRIPTLLPKNVPKRGLRIVCCASLQALKQLRILLTIWHRPLLQQNNLYE